MYSRTSLSTWKPYSKEVRDIANEIIHLWMLGGGTFLEHHLTTFAFLKINTKLVYVAQYHAEWLYQRYHPDVVKALWPGSPPKFEFAILVEYFIAKLGPVNCSYA